MRNTEEKVKYIKNQMKRSDRPLIGTDRIVFSSDQMD